MKKKTLKYKTVTNSEMVHTICVWDAWHT